LANAWASRSGQQIGPANGANIGTKNRANNGVHAAKPIGIHKLASLVRLQVHRRRQPTQQGVLLVELLKFVGHAGKFNSAGGHCVTI
jgi:hypothetical protein